MVTLFKNLHREQKYNPTGALITIVATNCIYQTGAYLHSTNYDGTLIVKILQNKQAFMRINMLLTILFLCVIKAIPQQILPTQLLVVGGTTGGTAAGIQAARSGVQTIIVEETDMLGGMLTAAGVSCTDGNRSNSGRRCTNIMALRT